MMSFNDQIGAKRYQYKDTDSFQLKMEIPAAEVIWEHGEITYIKGHNALRLAIHWLADDPECLAVQCNGVLYLKRRR